MSKRRIPYFDFYPSDFMGGVRGLSPVEVGIYTMLLCRIYEQNGPTEYSVTRLSAYCNCTEKAFEKAASRLIELGKIHLADGMISNTRAEGEISKRESKLNSSKKAGAASAEKRQQKQEQQATGVERAFNHTDTDTDTVSNGGGSAREAEILPSQTDRETILEAIGVDPVSGMTGHGGRRIGTQADMAEAGRWMALPGVTLPGVCAEIRRLMESKRDGPPSSFRYFTPAIQRLSGALAQDALSPITNGQPAKGNRNATDGQQFGAAIHRLAADLSAGRVQLRTDNRDPFAPRSGRDVEAG